MHDQSSIILSNTPLSDWRGSITTFNGFTGTKPVEEVDNLSWIEVGKKVCPEKPLIIENKKNARYFVPCLLKVSQFVGRTLEFANQNCQPTTGKMRSKNHVTRSTMLLMDIDNISEANFNAGLAKIESDNLTYLAFTTHSHGSHIKPGMRVRLILPLDRPLGIEEYHAVWHGFDQYYFSGWAGKVDSSGANMYQQQGIRCCHPDRIVESKSWYFDGGVASADALIAITQSAKIIPLDHQESNQTPKNNEVIEITVQSSSDATKIADRCQQIREFRDQKGKNQTEPLWRDCLGVVGFCTYGDKLSQQWSSEHSGYDAFKTSQKLAYRLKVPPTTCSQFKKSNPLGCANCTEKCHSPITLGGGEGELIGREDSINLMEKIQQQFCLINLNGKLCVLDRASLIMHSEHGADSKLSLSNRPDGALLIARTAKELSPQVDANKLAQEFILCPRTTCYSGVEFNPKGTSPSMLNLWKGPTIIPRLGAWELIKAYIRHVICDNDPNAYNYVIRYIAHALQKPEEKPGVMIVLIGGQGTGKGTLARIFKMIWGATFLQVHNIETIIGNFNAALEANFFVFVDEAIFSGDRKSSNALKSLVTETIIHINEKHQPGRQTRSYHRFIAATNADHFKNTERDDRRDFVLRVSEARKGDFDYWEALNHEIHNGGVAAMVHDLLEMDLTEFNVRNKPNTEELLQQKLQSLSAIAGWWYGCLIEGNLQNEKEKWVDFISTQEIIEAVYESTGKKMYRKPTSIDVGSEIAKLCPSAKKDQVQQNYSKKRGFRIPSLEQARTDFEQYIGGSLEW